MACKLSKIHIKPKKLCFWFILHFTTVSSCDSYSMAPHLMDHLEGVDGLDDMQRSMIKANHTTNLTALQGYHQKVSNSVPGFYDGVSKTSLQLDNHLQFAIELLSHVDGSLAELAKNKLLALLRSRARGVYVLFYVMMFFQVLLTSQG